MEQPAERTIALDLDREQRIRVAEVKHACDRALSTVRRTFSRQVRAGSSKRIADDRTNVLTIVSEEIAKSLPGEPGYRLKFAIFKRVETELNLFPINRNNGTAQ